MIDQQPSAFSQPITNYQQSLILDHVDIFKLRDHKTTFRAKIYLVTGVCRLPRI